MVAMNKKERDDREVEKRERLIQTFLIISGFLVASVEGESRRIFMLLCPLYWILTLVYYTYLTRTKNTAINNRMIDIFALLSSFCFSGLILFFIDIQLTEGFDDLFLLLLFVYAGIFAFSLLSPDRSEKLVNQLENFSKRSKKIRE